jgi:general secretion pathway protein H
MGRRVALAPRRTLPAGRTNHRRTEDGFTLLEIVCVLAIIAILAAILLPSIPHGTSRTRLEGYAIEIATLLRADHDAAMWRRRPVATAVDALTRSVRSGATGEMVNMPEDVHFEAMLAARCNQHAAGHTIEFFASGMSCGGTIRLSRPGLAYDIRANWLTGGIEVVRASAL